MSPLLQTLFARFRRLSWGQRGYSVVVLVALITIGQAVINFWRAHCYEAMHRRIAAAGGDSTRSVTVVDDQEEAYCMALLGDFSGLALTSVIASGPECKFDTALLHDLRNFSEISSFRLSQVSLQPVDFQQIYALENLTRLNLSYTNLTDANLAGIEKLESLDSLELQYTPLTDASIPQLLKVADLSRLDITGTDITPEGAERLRAQYKLFQGSQSTTQVIHRPAPSPRYRAAVTKLLPTNSYGVDARGGGGASMRLQLRGDTWKGHEQDLPLLAELTDVQSVTINKMPLTSELVNALASLPKLRVLNVSELPGPCDLSKFASCPNLRVVRISGMPVDKFLLASVARLESLQALFIFNSWLAPGTGEAFGQMQQVQTLQLRQVDGPAAEFSRLLAELQCCEQLRLLDLAAVPIDNGDVEKLARLTQLVSLGIGSGNINDDSVPALSHFTHLLQLDITGTRISGPTLNNPASGATQLEAALFPSGIRVVHPRSTVNPFPLNLADLVRVSAAEKAAAANSNPSAGTAK